MTWQIWKGQKVEKKSSGKGEQSNLIRGNFPQKEAGAKIWKLLIFKTIS